MSDFCEECGTVLLEDEGCEDCEIPLCSSCLALHQCDPNREAEF